MPNIIKLTPSLCGCSTIQIGYRVENDARAIEFDYSEWTDEYGSGAVELLVRRKGDQAAYPVALEIDGTVATWVISDTDTSVPGYGKAEYTYTVGTTLAKTAVFTFFVAEDLADTTQDPPDPYQTWVDTLTSLGAETLGNAIRAEEAADRAEDAQSAAEQTVSEAAQYAQGAEESATAAAQSAGAARDMAASALSSADRATASATASSGHATAASASATQAAESATSATQSATAASGSASSASTSATTAQTAATTATTAATNASASASSASASATAASGSASSASASATTATQAATSATTSANNASQSASAASLSATQASNSALSANDSATSAETFATEAAESEANAEQSATEAEASAQEAATEAAKLNNYLPVDTASGSIASFSDGADSVPLEALSVALEPVQDLHGQSAPYPAGGGKNKLGASQTATINVISAITFSFVKDSATITLNTDLTSTLGYRFRNGEVQCTLPAGTYTLSSNITNQYSGQGVFVFDVASDTILARARLQGSGTFTVSEETTVRLGVSLSAETVAGTYWFQLESGSTATTFAPYSNLCPITGHTAVEMWRSGVNVWDEEWEVGGIRPQDGTLINEQRIRSKNLIPCVPNTTYYFLDPTNDDNLRVFYYAEDGSYISCTSFIMGAQTTPNNARFMRFIVATSYGTTYLNNISINYPSTDHNYHAHSIVYISIPLGQTVYGGSIDVVGGKVVVDRAMVDMGDLAWSYFAQYDCFYSTEISGVINHAPFISSIYRDAANAGLSALTSGEALLNSNAVYVKDTRFTDATAFKSAVTGQTLVYELATPITIDLTDIPTISTLLGTNNIWSDSGDVSVEYRADIQKYITKVIAEAIS